MTSRVRRLIAAWPLWRQMLLVSLLVTLVIVVAGVLTAQRSVAGYLTARFEEDSVGTLEFLGGAVLEPLLAQDVPALENIVNQTLLRDRQILSMTIEDHTGFVLVNKTRAETPRQYPPFTASDLIRLDGRLLGRMSIEWSTDQARAEIRADGMKFAGLLLGAMVLLAVVLVLVVHYLIIAPIRRIHNQLVDVAGGKVEHKLGRQPSLELNQLAQSANALFDHVQADRLRRKELQREVEALADRIATLGQYTLLEKIGEGGMGEVWKAQHALLRRPTAVKLLNQRTVGPEALIRFEREVQLTSGLTHANTIAIYDFGHTDKGVFYYAMEYLEGWNLEQLVMCHGPQPEGRVIYVLRQVCGSLHEAHQAGLIHRDIKPANIFLCRRGGLHDMVKVLDFGLVAELRPTSGGDHSGAIAGTPSYLPPEAIRGEPLTAAADLYSLAAVGYFLVTGRKLFDRPTISQILDAHLSEPVTPPSQRANVRISSDLEKLLMSALSKHPTERPQSADVYREGLDLCDVSSRWTESHARVWWEAHGSHPVGGTTGSPTLDPSKLDTERSQPLTVDFHQRLPTLAQHFKSAPDDATRDAQP